MREFVQPLAQGSLSNVDHVEDVPLRLVKACARSKTGIGPLFLPVCHCQAGTRRCKTILSVEAELSVSNRRCRDPETLELVGKDVAVESRSQDPREAPTGLKPITKPYKMPS